MIIKNEISGIIGFVAILSGVIYVHEFWLGLFGGVVAVGVLLVGFARGMS